MSFDVNVLSTKPIIKAASSMQNDGGGGNLGYMGRERRQKEDEKKYLDDNIFMKQHEEDLFVLGKEPDIPEESFSLSKLITDIIDNIKNLFIKT